MSRKSLKVSAIMCSLPTSLDTYLSRETDKEFGTFKFTCYRQDVSINRKGFINELRSIYLVSSSLLLLSSLGGARHSSLTRVTELPNI